MAKRSIGGGPQPPPFGRVHPAPQSSVPPRIDAMTDEEALDYCEGLVRTHGDEATITYDCPLCGGQAEVTVPLEDEGMDGGGHSRDPFAAPFYGESYNGFRVRCDGCEALASKSMRAFDERLERQRLAREKARKAGLDKSRQAALDGKSCPKCGRDPLAPAMWRGRGDDGYLVERCECDEVRADAWRTARRVLNRHYPCPAACEDCGAAFPKVKKLPRSYYPDGLRGEARKRGVWLCDDCCDAREGAYYTRYPKQGPPDADPHVVDRMASVETQTDESPVALVSAGPGQA